MKGKTLLVIALIAFAIYWLSKKAKGATTAKTFKLNADWGNSSFKFMHPSWGTILLNDLDQPTGQYNELWDNDSLQLGWNKVPGSKIVVTLLHKRGNVFSEVYVLDLNAKKSEYYSELQPVTVTA